MIMTLTKILYIYAVYENLFTNETIINPLTGEDVLPYIRTLIINHEHDGTNFTLENGIASTLNNLIWIFLGQYRDFNYVPYNYLDHSNFWRLNFGVDEDIVSSVINETVDQVKSGKSYDNHGILNETDTGRWIYQFYYYVPLHNRWQNLISVHYTYIPNTLNYSANITNTHEHEVTEVNVTKVWEDNGNQDGIRPNNVTINLLADGAINQTVQINSTNWTYTFGNLSVYYSNGTVINYSIEEVNVAVGYDAAINRVTVNNYTVTNTHNINKTKVNVTRHH